MDIDTFGQEQIILARSKTAEQEAADERDRWAVRQLVARRALDDQDQALLLDVLGLAEAAPPTQLRLIRLPGELCAAPMRGERVCGRVPLHLGPHRSKTAIEDAELRKQRAGHRPAERIRQEKPA